MVKNKSDESLSGDENSNDIHSDLHNNNDNLELASEIGQWILRNKINLTAAYELLAILKKHGHEKLLNFCWTISRTPCCQILTVKKFGGDYETV